MGSLKKYLGFQWWSIGYYPPAKEVQGTWVPSLGEENSTCKRATQLMRHNY